MSEDLQLLDIDLFCPNCRKPLNHPWGWLEQNPTFQCPGCNTVIRIENESFKEIGERLRERHREFLITVKQVQDSIQIDIKPST